MEERRRVLLDLCELAPGEIESLQSGGLDESTCDTMIENVIGRYNLPFALALNFRINDRDLLVPMVIEEPSVVAAASNAARMIREGGGFHAAVTAPVMIGQVQILDVADPDAACRALIAKEDEIIALASKQVPNLVKRGGGPIGIKPRILARPDSPDGGMVVVHLHIDVRDAMGANMVNTISEGVSALLAEITGGKIGLRILSNLATQRTVKVKVRVPAVALTDGDSYGTQVRDAIISASRFAELDPYRAATHNKGIMNGVDAVIMATANDWRSVEAGAHAYAAQDGSYSPLSTWKAGEDGALEGEMTLPLAVGTVGGALQVHPTAQLALKILGSEAASDLAAVCAAAGIACNLAALRALATEGIQRGHMALHARIVARNKSLSALASETTTEESP